MDLDTLLHHYFGSDDPDSLTPQARAQGMEQLALDFRLESDGSRRFALWALMEALGDAPDPAEAFEKESELRDAAHNLRNATWRIERE